MESHQAAEHSCCRISQRRRQRVLVGLLAATLACGIAPGAASLAQAEVVWRGDFETQDFSQWDFELRPEGLSIVSEPVADGDYALRVELTSSTVWDNGIFRTELQHKPEASRASEGAELFFGWSVYLPDPLPVGEEQDYQLGYFETTNTNNQVFSLHAIGNGLVLSLNHDAQVNGWIEQGTIDTDTWHRIVYHVKWSSDPGQGFVSLWLDGVKLVDQAHARTFIDNQPAFIQLGLLKNPPAPPQPVVLYVDAAMEGDSYEDVSLGVPENEGSTSPPEGSVAPEPVPVDPTAPTDSVPPVEPDASSGDVELDASSDVEPTGSDTAVDPANPFVPNPEPLPTASAPSATAPVPGDSSPNPLPGGPSAPSVPSGSVVTPGVSAPSTPQLMPSVAPTANPSSIGTATPPASSIMSEGGPASDTGGCGVTGTSTSGWSILSVFGLGLTMMLTAARRRRSNTRSN